MIDDNRILFKVIDLIPAYVYLQAGDGSIRFANKTFIQLFGRPDGRRCYEILHGRSTRCNPCRTIDLSKNQKSQVVQWTHESGRTFKVHSVFFSTDDKSEFFLKFGIDITDRKQAEDLLRQNQQRFEFALRDSPVVIFTQDLDLRYTWVFNPIPKLGYTADQIIGKTDAELLTPESAAPLIEIKKRVLETGQSLREEVMIPLESGALGFDLKIEPIRDADGRIEGIICVTGDITDIKRLEFELRQSQQHYAMAERLAKFGHWVRNCDSDTAFWSAGIYHIFGIEPTTPAPDQDTFLSMVHPDDRQFLRKEIQRGWAFRKPNRVQYRIIRQDGSLRVVDSLIEPIIAQDGQTLNLQGTLQDVTEWSAAQDQLRKIEHELQEQLVDIERKRTALSVLLEHRENEKKAFADRLLSNAKLLILPYLEELDKYSEKKQVADIVDIIRRNLYELLSPFATQLSTPDHRLTPTEIKVADMVVHDKSSKEIAAILSISPKSVSHHRANIRKKLGLTTTTRKINLKTFLLSYQ